MQSDILKHPTWSADGTVCEEGWIGYHGNCYYFHNDTTLNYSDARQRCMSQNAELVSILSEDEYKFLADTRTSRLRLYLP
ncbi:hypothetical protein DPMN_150893 [Dreissena polymorpha]|uniref:C-type lectin domain-containing protein n=1 Tax=Dreissena polymorpha TaxID=45954 RepID=A0A9D4J3R8_DREPO|nr:hypothetical protein DPMN_150893 [Dreissena polymorpha]